VVDLTYPNHAITRAWSAGRRTAASPFAWKGAAWEERGAEHASRELGARNEIRLSLQRFAEPGEVAERASDTSLGSKACVLCALRERRGSYPVRIAEQLSDDEPAARLDHAVQLTQREVLIRDLTKYGDQECTLEAVARVWQ
jgi:hypothetical protein